MALITCPECGKQVSSVAKVCPSCGYPIADDSNNTIKIKIDPIDNHSWFVEIYDAYTNKSIGMNTPGKVIELKSDTPLTIYFSDAISKKMLTTTVKPGKKYRASWGSGWIYPKISACNEVDTFF